MKRFAVAVLLCALVAVSAAASEPRTYRTVVAAADGVKFRLYRYVPAGAVRTGRPVLLVPDLGFSRAVFDLGEVGLARFLQRRGREVYVLEPRGHGQGASDATSWHLRQLVTQDLPAAVREIARADDGPIDLVVHGYAGTLALAATTGELRGKVARVVALSTPVALEVPNAATREWLTTCAPISADGARFELLFARHGQFPPRRVALLRTRTTKLSREACAELLGWMESGDLALTSPDDTVSTRLQRYDRPTLVLAGLRNNFAHPEFATPLRDAPRTHVEVRLLTRLALLREDYPHLALLHGADAAADVFVPLLSFLDAKEAPPPATAEETP